MADLMRRSSALSLMPGPRRIGRWMQSVRSFWLGPWNSRDPDLSWAFGGRPVSSGVAVNEATALTYSAVWAAVTIIATQVANLPLVLYRKVNGGKERFDGHPLYRIIHDRPNPEMNAFNFREMLQAHVLLWGNAYAEIERDNANRVRALWPLTPNRVIPFRNRQGVLQYQVARAGGAGDDILDATEMLHIAGLGFDGLMGYSVVAKARESIGLGLATERFGGSFFGNGATFGGVISYPGPRPPELAEENYRQKLNHEHQGVDRAHKLLMVYNGAKYERMGIPPNDAQFLESRQFQINEIARWFNLPPHKLKELSRSTNNNVEQQVLEYYIDCLSPWLERWEQELGEKLISPLERTQQEIEFNATGILRGDVAARGEFYSKRFNTASLTPNDIRKIENENPIDGGDLAAWPLTHIPVSLVEEWYKAEIKAKNAKAEPPPPPPPPKVEPDPGLMRQIADLTVERDLARDLAQAAEGAKDEAVALQLTLRAQLEAAQATIAAHGAELARLKADQQIEMIAALEQQRTAQDACERVSKQLEVDRAVLQEVRKQLAAATAALDAQAADLVTARDALARSETRAAEAATARQVFEDLATSRSATVDQVTDRLQQTQAAIRDAIVHRLAGMVEYEADRVRTKQGSADKLRKWLDEFYAGDYGDRCRGMLRPTVKAWVLAVDHPEPVDHVVDLLVGQHVEQSLRQLRSLASEHLHGETLAPALEKLLRRWEATRADTLVGRILNEAA